ncbi:MAG TPA: tetratricopeptide repeat protein [Terriglobales bacterium]|nr:tetratricopeptide repeat protein [Terriglobales bacterium]
MRRIAILVLILLFVYSAAPADVIHLKNGHTIQADSTQQKGDRLEYQVGEDSYAIPMSTVARVESGAGADPAAPSGVTSATATRPEERRGSAARPSMPDASSLFQEITAVESQALRARLIRNGQVDRDALATIERSQNPHFIAVAYDVVAEQAYATGDTDTAERYLRQALSFEPTQAAAAGHYAAMLVGLHRYKEAIAMAEQATRLAPQDAGMWYLLGVAEFTADHTPQAIDAWKRSLAVKPSYRVQQLLARAVREQVIQTDYQSDESAHFTLHYEGGQSSPAMRKALLETLEGEYDDLSNQFGSAPRDNIAVIVYNNRDFTLVTEAPTWSDGMNDGKLRIAMRNMDSLTPQVAGVLKHELTHSFVGQATHDRCPQWLNEGIAQLVQGRTSATYGGLLPVLYRQNKQIPLAMLEGSFGRLSGAAATVAYGESLAAVEIIQSAYGFSDLVRILQRIGSGLSTEQALRATIHSSYSDLDDQLQASFGAR